MPRTRTPLKIRSIAYGRTFNNGNYESSRIELAVDLFEGDDPEEAFDLLIEEVERFRSMEKR